MNKEQLLGSETAKHGFQNEKDIINAFNNWKDNSLAQKWIQIFGYQLDDIENIIAENVKKNYKTDLIIRLKIKLKSKERIINLQAKLVSNKRGYNQIDKRWVDEYVKLWDIPKEIAALLKYFTGEYKPYSTSSKNPKRMFINEFSEFEQELLLSWLTSNKEQILSDIFSGRGDYAANWIMVIQKTNSDKEWGLVPMEKCIDYYGDGEIKISPRGSLKLGKITIQRKGGDNGRKSANMLQFKINPAELIEHFPSYSSL